MRERSVIRLSLYLAYLGALLLVGGLLYQRVAAFEGMIYLAPGAPEQVVVRPAGEGRGFLGSHRNMPLDVVPFRNPRAARRAFDADVPYDAQFLPFRLRLEEIEVQQSFPPRDVLRVGRGEDAVSHTLEAGGGVDIGGHAFQVAGIRPWAGLLRNALGSPMASVSLPGDADDAWKEVLLHADTWVMPRPGLALLLRWFPDQAAAEAATEVLDIRENSRWGVADGAAVHWSTAFTPGTGFTLRDGTEATLVARETDPPAIVAEFRRGDTSETERLEANAAEPRGRLRYEHPGLVETAYVLHAWRDAAALVTAHQRGRKAGARVMAEGETWRPAGAAAPLRLEQVMQSALPVTPDLYGGGVVHEAVLHRDGGALRLREGAMERWNGTELIYHRETPPPRVCWRLSVLRREDPPREVVLAPGGQVRVGDWKFGQDPSFTGVGEGARLVARRTMGGPARLVGMAMVVVGAFGWVLVRFHNAPSKPLDGADEWQDVTRKGFAAPADARPPDPDEQPPH